MSEKTVQKTLKNLLADHNDRRGLRHQWEQIDEDIQEEIKAVWAEIIRKGQQAALLETADRLDALSRIEMPDSDELAGWLRKQAKV